MATKIFCFSTCSSAAICTVLTLCMDVLQVLFHFQDEISWQSEYLHIIG